MFKITFTASCFLILANDFCCSSSSNKNQIIVQLVRLHPKTYFPSLFWTPFNHFFKNNWRDWKSLTFLKSCSLMNFHSFFLFSSALSLLLLLFPLLLLLLLRSSSKLNWHTYHKAPLVLYLTKNSNTRTHTTSSPY